VIPENERRILVVDDETLAVEMMEKLLSSDGYEVEAAFSGKFALAKLHLRDFDLVIVDINMPGMDGIELIRRIRELKPNQRIVVATGFPSQRTAQQAFKLGTLDYIAKPFPDKRLLEVVEHALRKSEESLVGAVQLTCEELIQLYALGQRTVVLEVRRDKDVGRIWFENGRVIHAETGDRRGEGAFYEIQSWRGGSFTTQSFKGKVTRTIEQSVHGLLLEGARRQDERARETS